MEIEDRFADWRSEMFGRLIHMLGAMAAEFVFYGQNTTGVGGDVRSRHLAGRPHGRLRGDGARSASTSPTGSRIPERREAEEDRVHGAVRADRQRRSCTAPAAGMMDADPMQAVVSDRAKRTLVAGLLGQAFVVAYDTILANRTARRSRGRDRGRARDLRRRRRGRCSTRRSCASRESTCSTRTHVAGDLIPPPSPAGRPEPDSTEKLRRDGLWAAGEEPAPLRVREPEPEPEPQGPLPESPYRPRFGFVTGALIGIALAIVGLGVILAIDTSSTDETVPDGWSAWTPTAQDGVGSPSRSPSTSGRSTGSATARSSWPSPQWARGN